MSRCTDGCKRPTPAQCHCSVCHLTFGGISGFDSHQRRGSCQDPVSLGMEERSGVWRRVEEHEKTEAFIRAVRPE